MITSLLSKYVHAINNKEAEGKYALLVKGYKETLDAAGRDIQSQRDIGRVLGSILGRPASYIKSENEQVAVIIDYYRDKAKKIASEYINATQIEAIEHEWLKETNQLDDFVQNKQETIKQEKASPEKDDLDLEIEK